MSHPVDLQELSHGYWRSRALFTAHRFGVFEHMEKPVTASRLSRELGLDRRATAILLEALVSLGLARKDRNGAFRNTPPASRHLIAGRPDYQGNIIDHHIGMWDNWSRLDEAMVSGKPQRSGKGRDLEAFIMGMHNIARARAPRVIGKLGVRGARRILDLGGGPGTYAMELARAAKGAEVVLFDQPDVLQIAAPLLHREGFDRRVQPMAGDILTDDIGRNYDLVFFSNIIHAYGPADNMKVLRKICRSLTRGGSVAIHDFHLDENPRAGLFGVNMLVHTDEGRTYRVDEVRDWLERTGFGSTRKVRVDEVSSMVIGRKS